MAKEKTRLLTKEEFEAESRKRAAALKEGAADCLGHVLKTLYDEELVNVKVTGPYGEATTLERLSKVLQCIHCGKVADNRDAFFPYESHAVGYGDDCFIATAAYGSSLAPELNILRKFRDAMLPKALVRAYYATSPPIAEAIKTKNLLKAAVRFLLKPIVSSLKRFFGDD